MNKCKIDITKLNVKDILSLLKKDDVDLDLLEQALLDKRKGITKFFDQIAKNNRLSVALKIVELYRQNGIYFSTETHDQVAEGTWTIDDNGIAKPSVNEDHDYTHLFPKRYTVSSYVSWPDNQQENVDGLNFSCDSLSELILCLATYLPRILPYDKIIAKATKRKR